MKQRVRQWLYGRAVRIQDWADRLAFSTYAASLTRPWYAWLPPGPDTRDVATLQITGDIGLPGTPVERLLEDFGRIRARELVVRLHSPGGEFAGGMTLYHALRALPVPVTTHVAGCVGSIATVVALAGRRITMARSGRFIVHTSSVTIRSGKAAALHAGLRHLEEMDTAIRRMYVDRTKRSDEQIHRWQMAEPGTCFTAEEAVAAGFVDAITDDPVLPAPPSWGLAKWWQRPMGLDLPNAIPGTVRPGSIVETPTVTLQP